MLLALSSILIAILSLTLGWYLITTALPDYQLYRCRFELFRLRDRLFDLAADGRIDFDHPAYGILRSTLNGNLRFVHSFGLFTLIMVRARKKLEGQDYGATYSSRLDFQLKSLPPDVATQIQLIRFEMHLQILKYMLFRSWVFYILGVSLFRLDKLKAKVRNYLSAPGIESQLALFDAEAEVLGKDLAVA